MLNRVRSLGDEIRACYERELGRVPELRGVIRVEFIVMTDGQVAEARATENTVSPGMGECLVALISGMHFRPGPAGGFVRYRFPFVFAPGTVPQPAAR